MNHPIHRRALLSSGMGALGAVALESLAHAAEGPAAGQASSPPDASSWAKPLAQDYTVVDRAGPSEVFAGCQPDIVRLPDGTLLCQYRVCTITNGRRSLAGMRLAVSRDDGATWQPQKHLDRLMGLMFVHRETLYQLGNPINRRGMFLRRSDDQGRTWSFAGAIISGCRHILASCQPLLDEHLLVVATSVDNLIDHPGQCLPQAFPKHRSRRFADGHQLAECQSRARLVSVGP